MPTIAAIVAYRVTPADTQLRRQSAGLPAAISTIDRLDSVLGRAISDVHDNMVRQRREGRATDPVEARPLLHWLRSLADSAWTMKASLQMASVPVPLRAIIARTVASESDAVGYLLDTEVQRTPSVSKPVATWRRSGPMPSRTSPTASGSS